MSSKVTSYRALRDQRQYLKLILANVVSRFGDSLDAIAFSWIMYEVTGNAAMIALIMAINYIPTVFLQPFVGVWVERFSKKKVLVLCNWGRGVMVTLTALLFLGGLLTPLLLIVITLANSTLEAFALPAGSAVIPNILDKDKYTVGMALNTSLSRAAELIGMAAAGGIIALLGSHTALLIDAATFVFAAIVTGFLRFEDTLSDKKLDLRGYFTSLAEGFRYVTRNRTLFFLVLLGACINFCAVPMNVLQAPYIAETLHLGPEGLSLMGISLTVGIMLGSFFCPKLLSRCKARTMLLIGGTAVGLAYFCYWAIPLLSGTWSVLAALAAASFLIGAAIGVTQIIFSANFMASIETEYMARVSAIGNALLMAMMPIGSLLCAAAVAVLPVSAAFLLVGGLTLVVFAAFGFVREFHKL